MNRGSVLESVWASISLPGMFPAIRIDNRWLADGGLVNPVPISVCRALGADVVIAVNLNGDIVGRHFQKQQAPARTVNPVISRITDLVSEYGLNVFSRGNNDAQPPGMFESIAGSLNIMQDRITRSRMAGDPPEVLIAPRLSHIGLLEFYRAEEAIREGEQCVEHVMPQLELLLQN